jgi:hypothetical protein
LSGKAEKSKCGVLGSILYRVERIQTLNITETWIRDKTMRMYGMISLVELDLYYIRSFGQIWSTSEIQ